MRLSTPPWEAARNGAGILGGKESFWDNTALLSALQILWGKIFIYIKIIVPDQATGPAVIYWTDGQDSWL